MSLFEDASLIVTPNGRKAGKIYALKPFNGSGDLTVVRATTKTEVNSSGVIVDVPINVPSFDYKNGSCPSILVEPQRTNLVFPSATATTQSRTVTAVAHTLSFYGTGSITLSGVATGTLVGTGVSNRVTLTFTPTAGSLTLTVTGSVTNWQLEAGANATSYIPTVASAVTRNADVISKTGISDLINSEEGVFYTQIAPLTIDSTSRDIEISDGNTNRVIIQFNTTGIGAFVIVNGVVQASLNFNNSETDFKKVALRYKVNDFALFVNGVKVAFDTSGATFPSNTLTRLDFKKVTPSSLEYYGKVKALCLWKTALTDTQLTQLTTP